MRPAEILVVDDNAINLKLVEAILRAHQHRVRLAANGFEAEEAIHRQLPDLVLLDLQMPGMDGYSLVRRLRANESTRDLPVVMLTAFAMKEDMEKSFAAGCTGFISKPIDPERFVDSVQFYLDGGSGVDAVSRLL